MFEFKFINIADISDYLLRFAETTQNLTKTEDEHSNPIDT